MEEERKVRHEPFARQAFEGPEEDLVNEALIKAVTNPDLEEVKALLAKGADPNYKWLFKRFIRGQLRVMYDSQGNPIRDRDPIQPFSPLRMIIFRYSYLGRPNSLFEIAKLLVEAGAQKEDALTYYENTYGSDHDDVLYSLLKS